MENAVYLSIASGVATTLIAVSLFFYLPLTARFFRWYTRWVRRSIRQVEPFGTRPGTRYATLAFGIISVAGRRLCLACYLTLLLGIVIPIAITIIAFEFGFSIIELPTPPI